MEQQQQRPAEQKKAPAPEAPVALVVSAAAMLAVLGIVWAGVRRFDKPVSHTDAEKGEVYQEDGKPLYSADDGSKDAAAVPTDGAAVRAHAAAPAGGGSLPAGFPAGFPVIAGARLLAASGSPESDGTEWGADWTADVSPAAARDFYKAALVKGGWRVTSVDTVDEGVTVSFEGETSGSKSSGWVALAPEGDQTSVGLSLRVAKP